jgi:hypothetical protein
MSPDEPRSIHMKSGTENKSLADVDAMLNDFNNQSQAEGEEQSFINKDGEMYSDNDELDPKQIDLENLNESELMALQQQMPEGDGDGDDDYIDVEDPEDLARRGLQRIQFNGDSEFEYLLDGEGNMYSM